MYPSIAVINRSPRSIAGKPTAFVATILRTVVLAAVVLASADVGHAQSLHFFKNYFLTGGYKVGGVGLAGQGVSGIATGTITMSGVPANAEVVAAFLYAQVVSDSGGNAAGAGVTFNGVPLSSPNGTFALIGDPNGATPCWSGGGGTGSGGGVKRTYSLRYDVLRMLNIGADGKVAPNGNYSVQLPDLGNSSATPVALGATLVLFYRVTTMPLNAFVIYDGSAAMDNSTHGITSTISGFYDPAAAPGAMTIIAGSAQANKSENTKVNGTIVGTNLFTGSLGGSWDNVTLATPNLNGAQSLTARVDDAGIPNADCVTFSAIVYTTPVNDLDGDGLLDRWETAPTSGTLQDPNGVTLPDLAAMGAHPNHKDVFIEIGYMQTHEPVSYGGGDPVAIHSHLLTAPALTKVRAAFANAPVLNPDGTAGIDLHFDVGNQYQGVLGVIPAALARGGESLDEAFTVCTPDPAYPTVCQFSAYPGTVGWKSGFRMIRDSRVSTATLPAGVDCDAPGNDGPGQVCERVFDRNRKDMFRYFFFPHLLAVPKALCLDSAGLPDVTCQQTNPLFHVPNTYTGVADFGGADGMVSMGGFLNAAGLPVGTDDQQAATFMHELGHTLALGHGGDPANSNCNPNYLSIMNYLFQLRLLVKSDGSKETNYSNQQLASLNESSLVEADGIGSTPGYRTAWYSPYAGVGTAATRHCDGSPITDAAAMTRADGTTVGGSIDWGGNGSATDTVSQDINFDGVFDNSMAGYNDWANIRLNQVGSRRNIGVWFFKDGNFFIGPSSLGTTGSDFGQADVARLDFGQWQFGQWQFGQWQFGQWQFGQWQFGQWQFGSNVNAYLTYGDLNGAVLGRNLGLWGQWQFGQWQFGQWQFGQWQFGQWQFGQWQFGSGAGDIGRGDGRGDFGFSSALGLGDGQFGEVTGGLAVEAGLFGGPTSLSGCVADALGSPACSGSVAGSGLRVQLTWTAADAPPASYVVFRKAAGQGNFTAIGSPLSANTFTFVDNTVAYETTYVYYVAARYVADGATSDRPSKTVTVTTYPQFYGFLAVQNLPPTNVQNSGSSLPIAWRFTLNGVAVDSSNAAPTVTLRSASKGINFTFNAEDPGTSGFKLPTALNGWTWSFNIQLIYPTGSPNAGQNLPAANDYQIVISSARMQAPFVSGKFTVKSK